MDALVRLDPAAGFALIGGDRVPLSDWGRDGLLQVGGERGPVLRAPRFGERSRVVWRALGATDPRSALAHGLLHVALERDGEADRTILEILALALAGADRPGPGLTETALRVARATGMDIVALDALDAIEVDCLAEHFDANAPSEWRTFVLDATPATDSVRAGAPGVGAIRRHLADRLLARAEPARTGAAVADAAGPFAPDIPTPPPAGPAAKTAATADERQHDPPAALVEPPAAGTARDAALRDAQHTRAGAGSNAVDGIPKHTRGPAAVARTPTPLRVTPVAPGGVRPIPSVTVSPAWRNDRRGWQVTPAAVRTSDIPANPAGVGASSSAGYPADVGSFAATSATGGFATVASAEAHRGPLRTSAADSLAPQASIDLAALVQTLAVSQSADATRPASAPAPLPDVDAIADELAQRLDDEAALRGVFR